MKNNRAKKGGDAIVISIAMHLVLFGLLLLGSRYHTIEIMGGGEGESDIMGAVMVDTGAAAQEWGRLQQQKKGQQILAKQPQPDENQEHIKQQKEQEQKEVERQKQRKQQEEQRLAIQREREAQLAEQRKQEEIKIKKEAEAAKLRQEAEAKRLAAAKQAEAEQKAKAAAEAKAKAEAEQKAKVAAEAKAKAEAEQKAKAAAEAKAKAEAEQKAKAAAEAKAKAEAEKKARAESKSKAEQEAKRKAEQAALDSLFGEVGGGSANRGGSSNQQGGKGTGAGLSSGNGGRSGDTYGGVIYSSIKQHFRGDASLRGKVCDIRIELAQDGTILTATKIKGEDDICTAAMRAINATKKMREPVPAELYGKYKRFVLGFDPRNFR